VWNFHLSFFCETYIDAGTHIHEHILTHMDACMHNVLLWAHSNNWVGQANLEISRLMKSPVTIDARTTYPYKHVLRIELDEQILRLKKSSQTPSTSTGPNQLSYCLVRKISCLSRLNEELVRFAEKSWLKVLFANLLWEKNIISTKKQAKKYGWEDKQTWPNYAASLFSSTRRCRMGAEWIVYITHCFDLFT
jgi:hypothetical protein